MDLRGPRAAVPGHGLWQARPVRGRGGVTRAIRARHRVLFWQTITVETRDLRYGYEAIARYLSGGHAGYRLRDSRGRGGRGMRAALER